MRETLCARLIPYGVAVLATGASLLIRWPLWPVLGDAVPHMTFFPAVMIAAYVGGFRPGLLATILSAVAANYFLTLQLHSDYATIVNDRAALILFVLVGIIISGLCESLHRARRRIVADERRRGEEAVRETEERFRQLAENIHEIYWMMDAQDGRIVYISPGYEEVSGRTAPESLRTTALLGRDPPSRRPGRDDRDGGAVPARSVPGGGVPADAAERLHPLDAKSRLPHP